MFLGYIKEHEDSLIHFPHSILLSIPWTPLPQEVSLKTLATDICWVPWAPVDVHVVVDVWSALGSQHRGSVGVSTDDGECRHPMPLSVNSPFPVEVDLQCSGTGDKPSVHLHSADAVTELLEAKVYRRLGKATARP